MWPQVPGHLHDRSTCCCEACLSWVDGKAAGPAIPCFPACMGPRAGGRDWARVTQAQADKRSCFHAAGQALQDLEVVLRARAGRAALEALQPESAALLRAYTSGCILGVNVTTAGALSAWTHGDAPVSSCTVQLCSQKYQV